MIPYITSPRSGKTFLREALVRACPELENELVHLHTFQLEEIQEHLTKSPEKVLFLSRHDTIRQTISLLHAAQTDIYHIPCDAEEMYQTYLERLNTLSFDFQTIHSQRKHIERWDAAALKVLKTIKTPILYIFYEDFKTFVGLTETLQSIFAFIERAAIAPIEDIRANYKKTDLIIAEQWYRKYIDSFHQLGIYD